MSTYQNACVTVRGLRIEYPGHLVFENVDLEVFDSEIIAIETSVLDGGTSLLKGIAGFLTGVEGRVEFEGVDLLHEPPDHILHRVGFVYEDHGLISLYNVVQNVSLPLQYHTDLGGDEIFELVDATCQQFDIGKSLYNLRPHRLNDVQTRLVNLARAAVTRPRLLLIDELEGGMSDELLQVTMQNLRQHQSKSPMAIIITTSSEMVMQRADRVFHIDDKALKERKLDELKDR